MWDLYYLKYEYYMDICCEDEYKVVYVDLNKVARV
jgi:hypothetical protein